MYFSCIANSISLGSLILKILLRSFSFLFSLVPAMVLACTNLIALEIFSYSSINIISSQNCCNRLT